MLDGVEDRLQLRIECRSDPPRDFNRDGACSAFDIREVARTNTRLIRGGLLRESEGFASCSYHAAQLAGIHPCMMDEDRNDRPGTIVPNGWFAAGGWWGMRIDMVRAVVVAIAAGLTALLNIMLGPAALADTTSTAAALTKIEQTDAHRIRACQMMKMNGDGIIGKVNDVSYAIRCFSVGGQLMSCFGMAVQAASFLDLERTGQSSFTELTNKIESESGAQGPEDANSLSLAERAPANMSPDQLGRSVYKQCSSYAEIQ